MGRRVASRDMETGGPQQLRRIPIFSHLDDGALVRISRLATEFDIAKGHVLAERGQPGSGMFIVERGTASVELPDGRRRRLGPGDFLGELSLLTDRPRTARVRATSDLVGLAISRQDFQALLEEEPSIAVSMLRVVAERLADTLS